MHTRILQHVSLVLEFQEFYIILSTCQITIEWFDKIKQIMILFIRNNTEWCIKICQYVHIYVAVFTYADIIEDEPYYSVSIKLTEILKDSHRIHERFCSWRITGIMFFQRNVSVLKKPSRSSPSNWISEFIPYLRGKRYSTWFDIFVVLYARFYRTVTSRRSTMGKTGETKFSKSVIKQFHKLVECPTTVIERIALLEKMEDLFTVPVFSRFVLLIVMARIWVWTEPCSGDEVPARNMGSTSWWNEICDSNDNFVISSCELVIDTLYTE